jgi:hypothetical protein
MIIVNDLEWKRGMALLYPVMHEIADQRMREAAEAMLAAATERVHVDTGLLRASGRIEERHLGSEDIYDIAFGGEEYGVDYAGYEESYHPYLTPSIGALTVSMEADGEIGVVV